MEQVQEVKLIKFLKYFLILKQFDSLTQVIIRNRLQMISETSSAQFSELEQKATLPPTNQKPNNNQSKFNKNFYQRTLATILMLSGFFIILISGQTYCAMLVLFLNFMIFRELNSLKRNEEKQSKIPLTGYLNWYIYFVINYYAAGILIEEYFPYLRKEYPETFGFLLKYHNIITCSLAISVFVFFVLTLKQRFLKYQFRMFGWICVSGFMVIYPSYYAIKNCFQGIFWFIVPALLIVVNDIFAYLFGYFFGKRQLIAISPKKTWEGYIGGAISTLIFTIILTALLQDIPGFTCKLMRPTLQFNYFQTCDDPLLKISDYFGFGMSRMAGHMLIIGLFASLVGPFGGFFASGLKRSIKIKDFADLIPGHGGVSDRMDCEILIATFTYFYLHSFLRVQEGTFQFRWVSMMNFEQKIQMHQLLFVELSKVGLI